MSYYGESFQSRYYRLLDAMNGLLFDFDVTSIDQLREKFNEVREHLELHCRGDCGFHTRDVGEMIKDEQL